MYDKTFQGQGNKRNKNIMKHHIKNKISETQIEYKMKWNSLSEKYNLIMVFKLN
jgi:hypothetical protein